MELVCELVSARLLQPVDHGLLKVHRVRLLVDQTLAEVAGVEFLQFQFRQVCSSFVHGCGYFNHVIFEFSLLPAAVLFFLTKKATTLQSMMPKTARQDESNNTPQPICLFTLHRLILFIRNLQ